MTPRLYRTRSTVYNVWAPSKKAAMEKAAGLASAKGLSVTGAQADPFAAGADYGVNWTVRVYWREEIPA